MPSNRRQLLAAVGALSAGLAGCLGGNPGGTEDESPTPTDTKTTSTDTANESTTDDSPPDTTTAESASFSLPESSVKTLGEVRVAVANPTVGKAITYESIMGSGGVLQSDGRQFAVAEVQSQQGNEVDAEGDPEYDAFELVVDGDAYSAVEIEKRTTGAYTSSLAERGDIRYGDTYATAGTVGWVVFEPPSPLDASEAAIRCRYGGETAEWSLPEEAVAELARPAPRFELESFDATVEEYSVDVSFVAKNVSENDGEFLAALYWPTTGIADDDESTILRRTIAAGEKLEWSGSFPTEYTDGVVAARLAGSVTGEIEVDLEK
ncbi:hypothetical protein [Haladaptatus sp. DYF46]|uniref:hypothetical protein n=1 Tax=Haladaptatus sp. DYF46 TaxID=2886041 RepID=UPI001E4A6AEC|nr:hypothetical protein [Haladaptatus sp. DYF46]